MVKTVKASDVLSMERILTPLDKYVDLHRKIDANSVVDRYGLYEWALRNKFLKVAAHELEQALTLNPKRAEQLADAADKEARAPVEAARAKARNAALDVRETEGRAKETKDPAEKQKLEARARQLKATVHRLEAEASKAVDAARKTYARIVRVYETIPDDGSNYIVRMRARRRGLRYRKYALDLLPDRTDMHRLRKRAEALWMIERLLRYLRDVRAALPNVKQARAVADLKDWGSEAELLAVELLFDWGGVLRSDDAMRILDAMPERWADVPALRRIEGLRIRKLVEGGQIDRAIAALDTFITKHPAEGGDLLRRVVTALQDRIDRDEGSTKLEIRRRWETHVRNYVRLAGKLYERVQKQPLAQRQTITQTYAHALVMCGKYAEAIEIFRTCQAYAAGRQRDDTRKIARADVQALNVLGLARAYKGRAEQHKKAGQVKEMQADYEQAIKYFRSILSGPDSVDQGTGQTWMAGRTGLLRVCARCDGTQQEGRP